MSICLQQIYLPIYKKEQRKEANNLISLKNYRKAEMEERNSLNIWQWGLCLSQMLPKVSYKMPVLRQISETELALNGKAILTEKVHFH